MSVNDSSDNPSIAVTGRISQLLQDGSIAVLATLIEAASHLDKIGTKLLVEKSAGQGSTIGSLGDEALDHAVAEHSARFLESKVEMVVVQVNQIAPTLAEWSEAQILFERLQQEPRLVICGAGHVGASLARLSAQLGYRATLIDDRAEFVRPEIFTDERIDLVATESWTESVRNAVGDGRSVYVAVVTRGHSEDEQCLRALIGTGADYIGLIGSKRRTNIVLQRLRAGGADEAILGNVRAPIGLDIGAVTPEEVALAIMAEIVAVRRGGKGGSLSEWRRN